jgi:type IV secretion system protein VirB10
MRKQVWFLALILMGGAMFPALAAEGETLAIPAGSTLHVRLITTLTTRTNQEGDPFSGKIVEPIIYQGVEVIPIGSILEGRVAYIKRPGRIKGAGEMRLVAETVTTPDNIKFTLAAGLEEAQGAEGARVKDEEGTIKGPGKSTKGAAVESGVGGAIGAGVGAISAGGSGALYGAGAGAAAGLIHTLFKKHKDIILPQGTELTFVVERTTSAKKVAQPSQSAE